VREVPPAVPVHQIISQGLMAYPGPGRGWYVLNADGTAHTEGGELVVWDSYQDAYENRRIRR
jgi:hypothetical protein